LDAYAYADAEATVRRHSRVAAATTAIVTTNRPATIIHSTDPSCWSGSHPDTAAIQSGKTGVISANRPAFHLDGLDRHCGIFAVDHQLARARAFFVGMVLNDDRNARGRDFVGILAGVH
jgi:hypothetical protein